MRKGSLCWATAAGRCSSRAVEIPEDAQQITIGRNGEVLVSQGDGTLNAVGQVTLARFVNAEGLKQIGRNLYVATDASGPAVEGNPQEDGLGAVIQRALELSNVDPVRELIDLITTQRAFEMNSQSIQSADETLRVVSALRR
jgi:flagellar basal-body rod protein FlgG